MIASLSPLPLASSPGDDPVVMSSMWPSGSGVMPLMSTSTSGEDKCCDVFMGVDLTFCKSEVGTEAVILNFVVVEVEGWATVDCGVAAGMVP